MVSYTPQQIVDMVNSGKGPADMYAGSDVATRLSQMHTEIAADMQSLQQDMQPHWKGDAAGQAYAGAAPLVQASQVSGQHLQAVQNLYQGQGSSFGDLHGKVAAVGNLGTKPPDDLVSGTPFSFMSNRADEIKAYNAKAQQVVDGYTLYHGQSTDNSGRWQAPSNYGQLGAPGGGSLIKPVAPPGGTGASVSHISSVGGGPGGTVGHGGSGYSGGPNSGPGSSNGGNPGGGAPNGGPGSNGGPGGSGSSPNPGGSSGNQPGGTSAAGYVSPPSTSGNGGNNAGLGFGAPGSGGGNNAGSNSGFGPGGGFGPVGGFSPGGGSSYGSGSGFGPGSGSGGAGSGSGARGSLGAGNSAGAGGAGGESAGGRATGGSASAARPGASGSGAGGMGRGGKGEGDEDAEHQRPAYLLENDPDEALIGELPRTSPPVIGL
jgi:hypothetical protein